MPTKRSQRVHGNASSGGRKTTKHATSNQQRDQDEPDRLTTKERPVSLGAVGKPCTGQTMADPEQRGQPEVEDIERACSRIRISARQPEGDRYQPKRIEHPHAVPYRAAHPGRWALHRRARQDLDGHRLRHAQSANPPSVLAVLRKRSWIESASCGGKAPHYPARFRLAARALLVAGTDRRARALRLLTRPPFRRATPSKARRSRTPSTARCSSHTAFSSCRSRPASFLVRLLQRSSHSGIFKHQPRFTGNHRRHQQTHHGRLDQQRHQGSSSGICRRVT